MTLEQAVNKMRVAGAKFRPFVGLVLNVPNDHYFFVNSDVPAFRIRHVPRTEAETPPCSLPLWETIHPDDQSGLIVFVNDRWSDRPATIVITGVQPSVAFARERASK
jgi:hypothetical protein